MSSQVLLPLLWLTFRNMWTSERCRVLYILTIPVFVVCPINHVSQTVEGSSPTVGATRKISDLGPVEIVPGKSFVNRGITLHGYRCMHWKMTCGNPDGKTSGVSFLTPGKWQTATMLANTRGVLIFFCQLYSVYNWQKKTHHKGTNNLSITYVQ